jgi:large subunit ribosomal protein L11
LAKRITAVVKLNIPGGKATPAPPVGPALGQHGINMMEFIKKFNEMTASLAGTTMPVEITIYEDRSFTFIVKQPLASELLKKAAGVTKGSGNPLTNKVGKLSKEQLRQVAKQKMPDLNTNNIDQAMRVLAGTARSMGIEIED